MDTTLESTPLKTSSACPRKQLCVAFGKLAAGGKVEKSSGQVRAGSGGGNSTGCANTRDTLWTYENCRIEPQKLTGHTYTTIQLELREYFIGCAFDASGAKKRGRRLADTLDATCRTLTDKSVSGTLQ